MSRVLVMGDIHGCYKGLLQCLERSKFDKDKDTLIQLGDIVDGWSEVYECVEELLTIKNLISIRGNHDEWFNNYLKTGLHCMDGKHGSRATINAYMRRGQIIEDSHRRFFEQQHNYYIDSSNRCFVHGGFNREFTIKECVQISPSSLYWDRYLWNKALTCSKGQILRTEDNFREIYIGHTTTMMWNNRDQPMYSGGIWNLDTGAGFKGKLTIMDVDAKEYWQSDSAHILYKEEEGRNAC